MDQHHQFCLISETSESGKNLYSYLSQTTLNAGLHHSSLLNILFSLALKDLCGEASDNSFGRLRHSLKNPQVGNVS